MNKNNNQEYPPVPARPLWKRAVGWMKNLFYFSLWLFETARWVMGLIFFCFTLYLGYGWIIEYLIYGSPKFHP